MDSQNLGIPGPAGAVPAGVCLQHWILQSCRDPPATGAPEPSRVPGHFRQCWEVLQQQLKVTAVEKDHQDLTHSTPPAFPGLRGVTAMGWEVLSSEFGGLSARRWGGFPSSGPAHTMDPLLLYTRHFLFKQPHARITQDGSSSSCGHIWHWLWILGGY